jgi:hypothetical protein
LRAELRDLVTTLQDLSGDGHRLASDLGISIMEIVFLQCNPVDGPGPNPKSLIRHNGGSKFGVHAGFGAFATD